MTDFEEKLMRMEVPETGREAFEEQLRSALLFERRADRQRHQLRLAWSLVTMLVALLGTVLLRPDLIQRHGVDDNRERAARMPFITDYTEAVPGTDDLGLIQCLPVVNPVEAKLVDDKSYRPQRTFVIQQYASPKEGVITVVSEYDKNRRLVSDSMKRY